MALPIFSGVQTISATSAASPAVSKQITSPRRLSAVAPMAVQDMTRSTIESVPVIETVKIRTGLPTNPVLLNSWANVRPPMVAVPSAAQTIVSLPDVRNVRPTLPTNPVLLSARPVATASPGRAYPAAVIAKTDLFVDPPKRPVLSRRLPPATMMPTRAAEDQAMPAGAGQKRVVGHDVAPLRAIRPSAPAAKFTPTARMTSTLAEKAAKNPFDQSMVQGGPVPPPPWYVDNYMHEYDKVSSAGFGAVEGGNQNWGWVLAAGLAVSAAWFWKSSRQ
jgi:hypothetical protein